MKFTYSPLSFAVLAILSSISYASDAVPQSNEIKTQQTVAMMPIVVQAEDKGDVGKTVYNKEDLEKTPNSSKNITDFLKVNPNVQFDTGFRSGKQQGELPPAEISINGGLPYENKILINGMSINNNINPTSTATSNHNTDMMGSSIAVAVNTDLLCNITLFDSNISAEYGEFLGGVLKAETCKPQTPVGELHGSISYDYTSDDWSRINHINNEEKIAYEESVSEGIQPAFTKQGLSNTLYGNLTEKLGLSLATSQRWSKIPLKTELIDVEEKNQTRQSDNISLEAFYHPSDRTQIKFGTQLFESSGEYFQNNAKNSDTEQSSDSQSFFIQMKNQFNSFQLEQQLNYQTLTSDRTAPSNMYSWLNSETKNWNKTGTLAQEGGFGDMGQQEQKSEYLIKAIFNPIKNGKFNSTFKMGTGYGHYEAYWKRNQNSYWYVSSTNLNGASCTAPDGHIYDGCDEGVTSAGKYKGQYAKTRTLYEAGEINIRQDRWHAFLENNMQYDQFLFANLGFRTDYDSLSQNNNVAPRTSFSYQPWGDDTFRITTGWNRYYGLNSFANELQDQKRLLQTTETRTSVNGIWKETDGSRYSRMLVRSQLDTPYSNETVFAINGKYANIDWLLKWVNRENKDQIRKTVDSTINKPNSNSTYNVYSYDNSGFSKSDIYTLSLTNSEPLLFKNSLHKLTLAADYTNTIRNFSSYDDAYEDPNELIYYDGKLIESASRPADNFNTPWTIRAGWDITFENTPLRINNLFSLRSHYEKMKVKSNGYTDENGTKYDSYSPEKNPSSFNWDIRTTYPIMLGNNYQGILGLTINNVTNKHNTYIDDKGNSNSEIGRQFIADISFKF
ncbi:hypothetical protein B9T25_00870 [Acinetobacter sp. ANC 4470]|nr:hypothetical protein B9T25_00870 [Acinetobacter sp. ANC 4470]